MAMTTANLERALQRPPAPAPIYPPPGYRPPRTTQSYRPPPPLNALVRLDPLAKLALCAAIIAPLVALAILLTG